MTLFSKELLPEPDRALPGREQRLLVPERHFVHQRTLTGPFPDQYSIIYFGLGCFWGAERLFWKQPGVYTTAVGYAGGYTPNPTYEEVCSGGTGHAEVVLVVYDPTISTTESLLKLFLESHDPTQGMRQGNDRGTQYRSTIYTSNNEQLVLAEQLRDQYASALTDGGYSPVTTETCPAPEFYYAEEYHQQYLAKNPEGYCGIGGTGICLPPSLQK